MCLTNLPASMNRMIRQCGTLNFSKLYRPPRPVTVIGPRKIIFFTVSGIYHIFHLNSFCNTGVEILNTRGHRSKILKSIAVTAGIQVNILANIFPT
jgi:hypothetical protein